MKKQLRHMSATIQTIDQVTLELPEGYGSRVLQDAVMLTSYNSRVALYADGVLYLLPRFDYSMTTWKHLHAFIQDYCDGCADLCASELRKALADSANTSYQAANGIVRWQYTLERAPRPCVDRW